MYQQNNQNNQTQNKAKSAPYAKPDVELEVYFHSIEGTCAVGQHNGSIISVYKLRPSFNNSQREETYLKIFISDKYVELASLQKLKPGTLINIKGNVIADFNTYIQMGLYPVFIMSLKTFWADFNFGKDPNVKRYGAVPNGGQQQQFMPNQQPQNGGYAPQSQSAPQAQIMTQQRPNYAQQPANNYPQGNVNPGYPNQAPAQSQYVNPAAPPPANGDQPPIDF